jgi:AraC family transcriptional regulator
MRDLLPIYRAIEWVEAHLQDEASVAEMAAAAGYSLFHFIRAFDRTVYHTPYDYLMRRRLSEAALELLNSDRRVVEIALDYRFGNHETFSRAFKRLFGVQPTQWRERGVIPHRALTPPFTLAYLEHIHRPGFPLPEMVESAAHSLVGLMAEGTKPEATDRLWRSLGRILERQPPKQNAAYFGVRAHVEGRPEDVFYLAAVEAAVVEDVAPPLVSQTLPAGKYVRLAHCGPVETLPFSLDFLFHTWLPKAALQLAPPLEIIAFGEARPWGESAPDVAVWLPVLPRGGQP